MTLVEILVALSILLVIMGIAYTAITNSVRMQRDQEAIVSTQGKLRRIVEVVTQDVRGAVFGSIIDEPYVAGHEGVSFMVLAGGAGYPVTGTGSGSTDDFPLATDVSVLAGDVGFLLDRQVVMVNAEGRGVLLKIEGVAPAAAGYSRLEHPACRNTIDFTRNMLMFEVETFGLRHEVAEETIFSSSGFDPTERPFAFDVAGFTFDYIYTTAAAGAEPIVQEEPRRSGGQLLRSFEHDGERYTLSQLKVVVDGEGRGSRGIISRTNVAHIDLSGNALFNLKELVPCS